MEHLFIGLFIVAMVTVGSVIALVGSIIYMLSDIMEMLTNKTFPPPSDKKENND